MDDNFKIIKIILGLLNKDQFNLLDSSPIEKYNYFLYSIEDILLALGYVTIFSEFVANENIRIDVYNIFKSDDYSINNSNQKINVNDIVIKPLSNEFTIDDYLNILSLMIDSKTLSRINLTNRLYTIYKRAIFRGDMPLSIKSKIHIAVKNYLNNE